MRLVTDKERTVITVLPTEGRIDRDTSRGIDLLQMLLTCYYYRFQLQGYLLFCDIF